MGEPVLLFLLPWPSNLACRFTLASGSGQGGEGSQPSIQWVPTIFFRAGVWSLCAGREAKLLKIRGHFSTNGRDLWGCQSVVCFFQQPFMENVLCALHGSCQFQKKQKCVRHSPSFQGLYCRAGKISCAYRSPCALQRGGYSGWRTLETDDITREL